MGERTRAKDWSRTPVGAVEGWPNSLKTAVSICLGSRHPMVLAAALDPEHRALYDVEYRTVGNEDGLIRWVAAKGRGIFDGSGRCVRVIGTAIDITDRKRAEEALSDADRRKDEFLAMLAWWTTMSTRRTRSPCC